MLNPIRAIPSFSLIFKICFAVCFVVHLLLA